MWEGGINIVSENEGWTEERNVASGNKGKAEASGVVSANGGDAEERNIVSANREEAEESNIGSANERGARELETAAFDSDNLWRDILSDNIISSSSAMNLNVLVEVAVEARKVDGLFVNDSGVIIMKQLNEDALEKRKVVESDIISVKVLTINKIQFIHLPEDTKRIKKDVWAKQASTVKNLFLAKQLT